MGSGNWIVDNLNSALGTWNGKLAEIWTLLSTGPEEFKGGGVWTVIVGINDGLKAIGYALLVIFFVMGVVKTCGSFTEMKIPAGLITACLSAEAGKIKAIRFYGDFFGNGDLEELGQAMVGLPLDEHLESALDPLHVDPYICGITAGELARLLRY